MGSSIESIAATESSETVGYSGRNGSTLLNDLNDLRREKTPGRVFPFFCNSRPISTTVTLMTAGTRFEIDTIVMADSVPTRD